MNAPAFAFRDAPDSDQPPSRANPAATAYPDEPAFDGATDFDADLALADAYFQAAYGVGMVELLTPVDDAGAPTGEDLRGTSLYRRIQDARRSDDPSLPLGPWERELKRADWPLVGKVSVQALAQRSKDLQLAAWALESGLHHHGLIALAPGLTLLNALSVRFWEGLFPGIPDGDLDYRTNLFRWIDDKFPNLIALVPLTAAGLDEELNLGDWRRMNLPDQEGRHRAKKQEEFLKALAATPSPHLADQGRQLEAARVALHALDASLDALCGDESPGFAGLTAILNEIDALVGMELEQRGETLDAGLELPAALADEFAGAGSPSGAPAAHTTPGGDQIGRRQEAYAMLAQAADALMQTDPHSPVPYLVRQAIAWGRMDTRALYQELFLELGGQINVFHLLGLSPGEANPEH